MSLLEFNSKSLKFLPQLLTALLVSDSVCILMTFSLFSLPKMFSVSPYIIPVSLPVAQVRLIHSHWSGSDEILRSHWLTNILRHYWIIFCLGWAFSLWIYLSEILMSVSNLKLIPYNVWYISIMCMWSSSEDVTLLVWAVLEESDLWPDKNILILSHTHTHNLSLLQVFLTFSIFMTLTLSLERYLVVSNPHHKVIINNFN